MSTAREVQAGSKAEADALCAADPLHAGVLAEMCRIQETMLVDGHNPNDPVTAAFKILVHPDTGDVTSQPLVVLTQILTYLERISTGLPMAMMIAANAIGDPDADGLPEGVRNAARFALSEGDPHGHFYAFGVCTEGIAMEVDAPNVNEILQGDNPQDHPDVQSVFFMEVVTRDSRIWDLVKQEREPVTYATTGPDEATTRNQGADAIVAGLTRFVTSMAG